MDSYGRKKNLKTTLLQHKWLFLIIMLGVADGFLAWNWLQRKKEESQNGPILRAADRYGLDPALVKAVVWRESQFDPHARGRAGEVGLMQVGPSAAKEWAEAERIRFFHHARLFDPEQNTLAGTWYLAKVSKRYLHTDNPFAYGLADYNAGRRNVLRWIQGPAATNSAMFIEQIDFPTTRAYVQTVLERYAHYRTKPIE